MAKTNNQSLNFVIVSTDNEQLRELKAEMRESDLAFGFETPANCALFMCYGWSMICMNLPLSRAEKLGRGFFNRICSSFGCENMLLDKQWNITLSQPYTELYSEQIYIFITIKWKMYSFEAFRIDSGAVFASSLIIR